MWCSWAHAHGSGCRRVLAQSDELRDSASGIHLPPEQHLPCHRHATTKLDLRPATNMPPPLHVQPSHNERTWSTGAIRFILQQCKEQVEAHNTITVCSYQWARIHKLLVVQFFQESTRKVKSVSD